MIELIIAFLISIGWVAPEQTNDLKISSEDNHRYGIVHTDDVGAKSITVVQDESGRFSLVN